MGRAIGLASKRRTPTTIIVATAVLPTASSNAGRHAIRGKIARTLKRNKCRRDVQVWSVMHRHGRGQGMVDEFYRDCDDAGGNEGMGAHDSGAREEGAAEKRQATTMASRYGLTLRIEILGQGQDRCDTMDNARHGAPADRAEQAGCDLVISLHLIDLGKDGRRDMSVHYGNAATQALADKLLAAVLPIAGTKSEETSPRPRLSVVKQEGAAALI